MAIPAKIRESLIRTEGVPIKNWLGIWRNPGFRGVPIKNWEAGGASFFKRLLFHQRRSSRFYALRSTVRSPIKKLARPPIPASQFFYIDFWLGGSRNPASQFFYIDFRHMDSIDSFLGMQEVCKKTDPDAGAGQPVFYIDLRLISLKTWYCTTPARGQGLKIISY